MGHQVVGHGITLDQTNTMGRLFSLRKEVQAVDRPSLHGGDTMTRTSHGSYSSSSKSRSELNKIPNLIKSLERLLAGMGYEGGIVLGDPFIVYELA